MNNEIFHDMIEEWYCEYCAYETDLLSNLFHSIRHLMRNDKMREEYGNS